MSEVKNPEAKPTVKQVFAICHMLCEEHGVEFPENRLQASEMIGAMKNGNGNTEGS